MLLYIVRHGDPDYARDCLTPKGKLQAQAVGRRLSVHGLDKIFVSPLGRAQETAKPACELMNIKPVTLEWLSESYAWSLFSKKFADGGTHWIFARNVSDFKTEENTAISIDDGCNAPVFAEDRVAEGFADLKKRADPFFEELGYKREGARYKILAPNNERIAFFCHQGLGLSLLCYLLAIPPQLFWSSFDLTHSSVTILEFRNYQNGYTSPRCLQFSDTSHIYAERLPLQYNNDLDI